MKRLPRIRHPLTADRKATLVEAAGALLVVVGAGIWSLPLGLVLLGLALFVAAQVMAPEARPR